MVGSADRPSEQLTFNFVGDVYTRHFKGVFADIILWRVVENDFGGTGSVESSSTGAREVVVTIPWVSIIPFVATVTKVLCRGGENIWLKLYP